MDLGLNGRTAIVCGASQGMGLAIAEAFAREGMNVAMFARRRRVLETEAERIGGKQSDASAKPTRPRSAPPRRRVIPVQGDVTNPQDCVRLVESTVEAFGGVDVLVNNSGGPPRGSALEMDDETLETAVALLLTSAVRLTNLCLPHLRKSPAGRIVNIESSTVREPADNLALSNAVRPGVVGWAKTLSREIGPEGITINTIAPGRIDTERLKEVYPDGPSEEDLKPIPLRRLGRPDEIAAVVCFLASDAGSYVTGTVIAVDGGLTRGLL